MDQCVEWTSIYGVDQCVEWTSVYGGRSGPVCMVDGVDQCEE